jgi:hypothetical protein
MKEKTKQKFNEAKEYVVEHKSDIIAFCATTVVAVAAGRAYGAIIGKYIGMTNAEAYRNGWQKGMSDFHDRMLRDNIENAEVVKALVEFQDRNTK